MPVGWQLGGIGCSWSQPWAPSELPGPSCACPGWGPLCSLPATAVSFPARRRLKTRNEEGRKEGKAGPASSEAVFTSFFSFSFPLPLSCQPRAGFGWVDGPCPVPPPFPGGPRSRLELLIDFCRLIFPLINDHDRPGNKTREGAGPGAVSLGVLSWAGHCSPCSEGRQKKVCGTRRGCCGRARRAGRCHLPWEGNAIPGAKSGKRQLGQLGFPTHT